MDTLLVADHPYTALLVLERLTGAGYDWQWVQSVDEAVKRGRGGWSPSLVVCATTAAHGVLACAGLRAVWPSARFVHAGPTPPVAPMWLELVPSDPLDVELLMQVLGELRMELDGARTKPPRDAVRCPHCDASLGGSSPRPALAVRAVRQHLIDAHGWVELDAQRAAAQLVTGRDVVYQART